MSGAATDDGPQAERSRRIQTQAYLHDSGLYRSATAPTSSLNPGARHHDDPHTSSSKQAPDGGAARSISLGVGISSDPTTCCSGKCYIEAARLTDEREFLRKYVERLLGQLRSLLQKYGELDRLKTLADPNELDDEGDVATRNDNSASTIAPWLTVQEVTNPLFQAYDLKIQELESAIEESKKTMDRFANRAESLAKENTVLRQDLESAAEKLALQQEHAPRDLQGMNDALLSFQENGEYLQEFNERIDVLMAENNMLMEQVSLQDDEISAMKKELADRDQQLHIMEQNFNEATVALQELRDSCIHLREEKQHCEKQLQHYAASLAQVESSKQVQVQQTEAVQAEKARLESQLAEYEALLSNAKKNAQRKDEQFSVRYQNVCTRLRELSSVIDAKEKQLDEAQERTSGLQTELESVRQDCEGMLNVMNSMEKQLNQYSAREDAVAELEAECKTKVENLLLQKEEVSAREIQGRREIARLLERLQSQTAAQLKAEEETTATLQRQHLAQISAREEEIQSLNADVAQLRSKLEALGRNQKDTEKRLAETTRHHGEATVLYERKLRELADRAADAEEARDGASRIEAEYTQKLEAKEKEMSKLRGDLRDRVQDLNDKSVALERELEVRRNELREAKDEIEEKHQKIQLLNDQLAKVKTDCSTRFTSELDVLHKQNRELKLQVEKLEYQLSQAKREASATLESSQNERERAEVRYISEIESLKGRVQALKEERARVEKSRQEAESRCGVLTLQVQQLSRELTDAKELIFEQEHACEDSDRKVTELSSQLTLALSKQQQLYRQERELRNSLERMTLEHARAEREAKTSRKKLDEYRAESYAYLSSSRSQRPFERTDRSVDISTDRFARSLGVDTPEKETTNADAVYSLPS